MSGEGVLAAQTQPVTADERTLRTHAEKLARGNFMELIEGSELWEMLDRLPQGAASAAVREKAEDVFAHARLFKKPAAENAMLETRVNSLGKAIGEWLAQEGVKHEGNDTYYMVGQRAAESFAQWAQASKPQPSQSR